MLHEYVDVSSLSIKESSLGDRKGVTWDPDDKSRATDEVNLCTRLIVHKMNTKIYK